MQINRRDDKVMAQLEQTLNSAIPEFLSTYRSAQDWNDQHPEWQRLSVRLRAEGMVLLAKKLTSQATRADSPDLAYRFANALSKRLNSSELKQLTSYYYTAIREAPLK